MPATPRPVAVTYVPADCGSIVPGKAKAPAAFQGAGLVAKLHTAGASAVTETTALATPALFRPVAPGANGVRDEGACIQVCHEVQASLTRSFAQLGDQGAFHLILGGECSMLPGLMTAFWQRANAASSPRRVGLVYIDADTDLYSPRDSGTGTFAGMNMTNLLRAPGALDSTRGFTRPDGRPVCDAGNTVFLGTNMAPGVSRPEHLGFLFDNGFRVISAATLAADPQGSARQALAHLEDGVDEIVVHLDVDAIDPVLFPLANVPNFTGVAFERMMGALSVLLDSDKVVALSVAEVNPDHDPGLGLVAQLTDAIVPMVVRRVS